MRRSEQVLTTGEVAKLCNVAPRTVSKWFDSGQLRGYRIPGSKDRRIPREQLIRFMLSHGIPLNGLENGLTKVLVIDSDSGFSETIRTLLCQDGGYEVVTTESAFEAGAAAHELEPNVVLVDVLAPDVNPRAISRYFRSHANGQATVLIATAKQLTTSEGQSLLNEGFDGYLPKPFDIHSLVELIDQVSGTKI